MGLFESRNFSKSEGFRMVSKKHFWNVSSGTFHEVWHFIVTERFQKRFKGFNPETLTPYETFPKRFWNEECSQGIYLWWNPTRTILKDRNRLTETQLCVFTPHPTPETCLTDIFRFFSPLLYRRKNLRQRKNNEFSLLRNLEEEKDEKWKSRSSTRQRRLAVQKITYHLIFKSFLLILRISYF